MMHDNRFGSGPRTRMVFTAALALACAAPAAWAFPPPITPSFPADLAPEQFVVDLNNVQTVVKTLKFDPFIIQSFPEVYWFKYTADGMSKVQFDLLGTNISTFGHHPGYENGNYASLGFGTYDQTQIAVYDSAGQLKGTSIGWYDETGHSVLKFNPTLYSEFYPPEPPFPQNPGFADDPIIFINSQGQPVDFSGVVTQGLARVVFEPNAPTNPRWDADPDDPNPVDPGQYGDLNEYEVWDTAISSVLAGGPGWRAGDRARYGPGARWDHYEALPAGEYFIAISSGSPTHSGDVYPEEILQAPMHYDPDTMMDDVPVLTENMGPFQYYMPDENPAFTRQFGTIVLNVRHEALTLLGDANKDGQVTGADLISVQQNFGNVGPTPLQGDANNDGQVTGADLISVQQNFGNVLAPATALVPEPATLFIIGATTLLALQRRSS